MKHLPLLLIICCANIVNAEPYKIGTQIPDFSLKDQHGQMHKIDQTVRLILFCKGMRGQNIIKETLDKTNKGYLTNHHTIYIVDNSGMPRLIGKFIALPKLRKRPYLILLDSGPSVTKDFPSKKDKVTLLYMSNYIIKAIEFVDTPEDVKKAIEKMK